MKADVPRKKRRGSADKRVFELSMDSLQGRWRHSSPALGMFTVKNATATFDNGSSYTIRRNADEQIELLGWQVSEAKSTPEKIVWTKDGGDSCAWHLEDEVNTSLPEVNVKNIISSKRHRGDVDYKALDREMRREEGRRAAPVRDEDSEDSGGAQEAMSSKEWSEQHDRNAAKATALFVKWVLSTRTPQHEEKLRRRGSLSVTIPVRMTGVGQGLLDKELRPYGVQVAHRAQGSVVIMDLASRQRFKDRHEDLWKSTPLPKAIDKPPKTTVSASAPAPTKMAEKVAPNVVALSKPVAAAAEVATSKVLDPAPAGDVPVPGIKRRRLRRIAGDSDDDGGGKGQTESKGPAAPAAESLEQAQALLDASPSAESAVELFAFLERQSVDAAVLVRTKIGATVNRVKKSHIDNPKVVAAAGVLVERWRQLYRQRSASE